MRGFGAKSLNLLRFSAFNTVYIYGSSMSP